MLIKRLLNKAFKKLGGLFYKISSSFEQRSESESIQYQRCQPWFKSNGDKTLRLNYDLGEDSIVFDLGGYEGQWASDIFNKYGCQVYIFEPYKVYADNIRNRFSRNNKIKVFEFGLSKATEKLHLQVSADSSSLFKKGDQSVEVALQDAYQFFIDHTITGIDLMKVNIEGGEYDLLERLIESDFIKRIKNIQVQFHDFVPHAEERMKEIQQRLSETHSLTYQFEFVWENWSLHH